MGGRQTNLKVVKGHCLLNSDETQGSKPLTTKCFRDRPKEFGSRDARAILCMLGPAAYRVKSATYMSSKVVDRRNQSEQGEYGVSFASRQANGSYEHAFVVWFYSDPKGKRTNRRAAGFYPTGAGDEYDLIIGGVPGQVEDDSQQAIAQQLIVLVNKAVSDVCVQAESQYKDATYHLLANNCVSFVEAVGTAIPGLKLPNRLTHMFPSTYVSSLFGMND